MKWRNFHEKTTVVSLCGEDNQAKLTEQEKKIAELEEQVEQLSEQYKTIIGES